MRAPTFRRPRIWLVCAVTALVATVVLAPPFARAAPDDSSTTTVTTSPTTVTTTATTTTATTTTATTSSSAEEPAPPSSTAETTTEPPPPSTLPNDNGILSVLVVALTVVGIALVAAAAVLIRYRRRLADRQYVPRSAYSPSVQAAPSVPSAPAADIGRVVAERDALAATCIQLADAVRDNPALVTLIQQGLGRAGYFVIDPTGQPFEGDQQEALQIRPTTNRGQDGIIAASPQVGYRHEAHVIRQPGVVVYRYQHGEENRW